MDKLKIVPFDADYKSAFMKYAKHTDVLIIGSGLAGAVASTIKNVIMEYSEQKDKTPIEKENADIIIAALNISPPIGSKVRKINNFLQTEEFEKDVIAERGFDVTIDGRFQLSPAYDMVGELTVHISSPLFASLLINDD